MSRAMMRLGAGALLLSVAGVGLYPSLASAAVRNLNNQTWATGTAQPGNTPVMRTITQIPNAAIVSANIRMGAINNPRTISASKNGIVGSQLNVAAVNPWANELVHVRGNHFFYINVDGLN